MTEQPHSHVRRPLLEVLALTKHFGQVKANTDVSLEVWPGEVHALVGENGAGKSTLLKMIYGVYHPDSGQLAVDGREAVVTSPADARRLGIGMVFQDLRLVPALTVAENIALAMPEGLTLQLGRLAERIDDASRTFGLSVTASAKVGHLSIGERQRVEILKVLMTGARLVILDEPTSVLAPQEVEALFGVVDHLRQQGFGVVIVTHKLDEVRTIADKATVLRAGRTVLSNVAPGDYTDGELVEAMVGRSVPPLPAERTPPPAGATPALALAAVTVKGHGGSDSLTDVDLTVGPGELVGIAGVSGNGQRELYEVALGLVALPALMLGLGLAASRFGNGPVRFTGPIALAVNAALGVALFATQYTAGGAALFVGTTLIVAAWLAQPGCELSVLSNAILRRDDQIGCFVFTPIDELERRLSARTHQRRARTETGTA
jgi:simple sugar transport system ATP-binding protein